MPLIRHYSRWSPRRDAERCESDEQQDAACRQWIGRNPEWLLKHKLCAEPIEPYVDEDTSGLPSDQWALSMSELCGDRPELDRLIRELCPGDLVLVYDIDRLGRHLGLLSNFAHAIMGRKAYLVEAAYGEVHLRNTVELWMFVNRVFASMLEREKIGQRTSDHMLIIQQNGRAVGGNPPAGKRIGARMKVGQKDITLLEDDPKEQELLQLIRDLAAEGWTAQEIRDEANKRGHRTRKIPGDPRRQGGRPLKADHIAARAKRAGVEIQNSNGAKA